jgi:CheY-like chemotaxis protein
MKLKEFIGKSIIIADDEEYIRSHIAKKLEGMGLTVLQAGTGEEVLNLAEGHPDMIVMDVRMPILDGLETARRLKSSADHSGIPIVLLSALAPRDEIRTAPGAGADEYVMKPITFSRLMESIRRYLGAGA